MNEDWKPLEQSRWRVKANATTDQTANDNLVAKPNVLQNLVINLARASFLHRGFYRPVVSRVIFFLGAKKPIDVGFRGAQFRLSGGRNLMEHGVMLHPEYNKTDIDFLESALSEGSVFIDIGSNIGLYTLPLAKAVGLSGKVIAIDANPLMAATLALNAKISGISNIDILSVAVSDIAGRANLAVRKNDDAIVRIDEDEAGEITVTTLHDIVANAGLAHIDALKIDIEGHEDKALAPFINTVDDALLPKAIVIECVRAIGDYPACAAAFARRGYTLKGRTRNNSLYSL